MRMYVLGKRQSRHFDRSRRIAHVECDERVDRGDGLDPELPDDDGSGAVRTRKRGGELDARALPVEIKDAIQSAGEGAEHDRAAVGQASCARRGVALPPRPTSRSIE